LEGVNRSVNIYNSGARDNVTSYDGYGVIVNIGNAVDGSWTSYATLTPGGIYFNYTFPQQYNLTWKYKDYSGTYNTVIPPECWASTVQLQVIYSNPNFIYSCYNQYSAGWDAIDTHAYGTYARFYEENVTYFRNSTYTTILPYGLNNCTGGSGTVIMTFYTENEETFGPLVTNYSQTFFLTTLGNTTGYVFTGSSALWSICVYPPSLNASITSYETYLASGYPIRSYIISNGSTLTPTNYTRYLGAGAYTYTFSIMNQYGGAIEGAYIEITKFNNGTNSWEIVSNLNTDYTGSSGINLVPFSLYRVSITKAGYTPITFDFTPTTVYSVDIYLSSLSQAITSIAGAEAVLDDVVVVLMPNNQTFFTNNTNITYGIVSNSSSLEYWGIRITKDYNGTSTVVYTLNSTNATGGLVIYTTNGTGYYRVKAWWKHQNYSLYDPSIMVYIGPSTGLGYARSLFGNLMNPFTFYLLAIIFTAVVVGWVSQYTTDGAGLVGLVILWGFTLFNMNATLVCLVGDACITPFLATSLTTIVVIAGFYVKQYV
jgi:hypothetical protein